LLDQFHVLGDHCLLDVSERMLRPERVFGLDESAANNARHGVLRWERAGKLYNVAARLRNCRTAGSKTFTQSDRAAQRSVRELLCFISAFWFDLFSREGLGAQCRCGGGKVRLKIAGEQRILARARNGLLEMLVVRLPS